MDLKDHANSRTSDFSWVDDIDDRLIEKSLRSTSRQKTKAILNFFWFPRRSLIYIEIQNFVLRLVRPNQMGAK